MSYFKSSFKLSYFRDWGCWLFKSFSIWLILSNFSDWFIKLFFNFTCSIKCLFGWSISFNKSFICCKFRYKSNYLFLFFCNSFFKFFDMSVFCLQRITLCFQNESFDFCNFRCKLFNFALKSCLLELYARGTFIFVAFISL